MAKTSTANTYRSTFGVNMARPQQYDETQVLESATDAFWKRGYAATSMAELIQATGLKSGSIYGGFGSKQGLFEASIDHYAAQGLKDIDLRLSSGEDYLESIRSCFAWLIESSLDCKPDGCFLVNALIELAPHDTVIRQTLKDHIGNVEQAFTRALTAAKSAGQLQDDADIAAMAKKIMVSLWGIRVIQRTGLSVEEVETFKHYYCNIV
ncbi:hypothetical protein A9Q99_10480 [Gammaproteobacteria bacterium 45_16_T64]|nr:hypothetical protein A9Q99_10480 [Gammaproteobacteria bacterium 45_16_T64]